MDRRQALHLTIKGGVSLAAGSPPAGVYAGEDVDRLRPGSIRTGDIYNLESWQESLATTEMRGGDVRGELLQQLRRTGSTDPDRMYSVVTTNYAARERSSELLGKVGSWQRGILIRDATIAYLKDHGFRSQASCSSTSA